MKNRKPNRLKGYVYSRNNLYFITNCVKNNLCCLGSVVRVGTGRDLSVQMPEFNPKRNSESNSESKSEFNSESHPESDCIVQYNSDADSNQDIEFKMNLNQYGQIVEDRIKWLMDQYPYVIIHNYQVMPNHFHFILEIDDREVKGFKIKSVSSLLGALKTTSSKLIHLYGFLDFEWHRSFYDTIIRDEIGYLRIFNYITNNPTNWGKDKFFSKG